MLANMDVVLSSDHTATKLRRLIYDHIAAQGWCAVDMGPSADERCDYPEKGAAAARLVAAKQVRFGIVLCGTGQGIMMAANKITGIRCGVCSDPYSARMIRQHNDANMLALGARVIGEGLALDIVDAFLSATFEGGRHAPRVRMLDALDLSRQ